MMDKIIHIGQVGEWYVGLTSRHSSKKFFTVEDGSEPDIHVYEHPVGASKKQIRVSVHLAYIEPYDNDFGPDGRRVAGRYPNYFIEEVRR